VLLWLDPEARCLSAMMGYGLEPLVSEDDLASSLAAAGPLTEAWRPIQAVEAFSRGLGEALVKTSDSLHRVFGWDLAGDWVSIEVDEDKGPQTTAIAGRRDSVY